MRRYILLSTTAFLIAAVCLIGVTGCSTLAALGLPVGSKSKMLKSTEEISRSAIQAAPLNRELNKTVLPQYIVEPSDVLYVEPAKFDSPVRLPGDQPVQPDGTIELGQYGRLQVVGKTIEQIQREVQLIVETAEPKAGPIVVRLVSWDSKEFYVLGEVNSPGVYHFDGNETVLDAIVAAGGLTNSANKDRIVLTRPSHPESCRIVLPICYDQIVQLGDTSTNYQLMPGDRVFVGSTTLLDEIKKLCSCCKKDYCKPCMNPQFGCDPYTLTTEGTYSPPVAPPTVIQPQHETQSPAPVFEAPIPPDLPEPKGERGT